MEIQPSYHTQAPQNPTQGQEQEDFMKAVMQQASLHSSEQNSKKVKNPPGWSIPTNMTFQNPGEPIMMDSNKLSPGSYFGKLTKFPNDLTTHSNFTSLISP